LLVAAVAGFTLGITQSDRKAGTGDAAPIAANLPANVVIKDAQPLPPPPPPPPKAKLADDGESDEASDEEPVAVTHEPTLPDEAPPPPVAEPASPSKPGGPLPADLPPT
jgi:hypothetical protein